MPPKVRRPAGARPPRSPVGILHRPAAALGRVRRRGGVTDLEKFEKGVAVGIGTIPLAAWKKGEILVFEDCEYAKKTGIKLAGRFQEVLFEDSESYVEHWNQRRSAFEAPHQWGGPQSQGSLLCGSMPGQSRRARNSPCQRSEESSQGVRSHVDLGAQHARSRRGSRRAGRTTKEAGRRERAISRKRGEEEEEGQEEEEKFIQPEPEEEEKEGEGRRGVSRKRGRRAGIKEEKQEEREEASVGRKEQCREGPEGGLRPHRLRPQGQSEAEGRPEGQEEDEKKQSKVRDKFDREQHLELRTINRRKRSALRHQQDPALSTTWSGATMFRSLDEDEGDLARSGRRLGKGRRGHSPAGHQVHQSQSPPSHGGRTDEGSANDSVGTGPTASREDGRECRPPHSTSQSFGTDITRNHLAEGRALGTHQPQSSSHSYCGRTRGSQQGPQGGDAGQRAVFAMGQGQQSEPERKEGKDRGERKRQRQEEGARSPQEPMRNREDCHSPEEKEGLEERLKRSTVRWDYEGALEETIKSWDKGFGSLEEALDDGSAAIPLGEKGDLPLEIRTAAEGAATPSRIFSPQTSHFAEKKERLSFTVTGGIGEVFSWIGARVDVFLQRHCKTKPTGGVFPLPTSTPVLLSLVKCPRDDLVSVLRLVCLSLNSLNGEGINGCREVSPFQKEIISFLEANCMRVLEWKFQQEPAEWSKFFQVRSIDYKGEEVQTAQPIQWENIRPALPKEVGTVALESVVELGCRHYVENFPEYLLPVEDQKVVKPLRLWYPLKAGICCAKSWWSWAFVG